jgi:hypothetical protein
VFDAVEMFDPACVERLATYAQEPADHAVVGFWTDADLSPPAAG